MTLYQVCYISEKLNNSQFSLGSKFSYPKIHILIPIYNESKTIVKLLSQIEDCFHFYPNYKITVIDDGSSDDSVEKIKYFSPLIQIISNITNAGKGVSLMNGFKNCTNEEIIVTMDGDGEHIPEDIEKLITPIIEGKSQSVIGSRFEDNAFLKIFNSKYYGTYSKNGKDLNFLRRFGNWIFSLTIWMAQRNWVVDSQSGFRAFSPGVVNKFTLNCRGFQIETDITMQLLKNGIKIDCVPIETGFVNRPSYMNILKDSFKIILTIVRNALPKKINRWLCQNILLLTSR